MEHESFENAAVAGVLNEHFVSIKVDREERPDVDRVYMTFVQATTGSGGWPMSVWLTPDLKPFYGGTYFPPTSRWGRPGFVDILQEIARVWRGEREKVRTSAEALTDAAPRRRACAPRQWRSRGGGPPADGHAVSPVVRPAARRIRRRAEVPAPERAAVPAARARADRAGRGARHGAGHAARDGARRDARSRRRRLPSLFGRCRLARAALREDALRPGPAHAGLPRGRAGVSATRSTSRSPKTRSST